jgi:hypothetical protein
LILFVVIPMAVGFLSVMLTEPLDSGVLLSDELTQGRRRRRIFVSVLGSVIFCLGCFVGAALLMWREWLAGFWREWLVYFLWWMVFLLPSSFFFSGVGVCAAVFLRRRQVRLG